MSLGAASLCCYGEGLTMKRSNTLPPRVTTAMPASAARPPGRAIPRRLAALALLGLAACEAGPLDAIELAPTTLTQGMVAHWTFDEGEGTVVLDSSGNMRDGALTGGTWVQDGRFGKAMHLGEGEFMAVDSFPNATASWSVSAWVRLTSDEPAPEVLATVVSTENIGGWEINIDYAQSPPGMHFGFWKGPETSDYQFLICFCMEPRRWTHAAAVVDGEARTMSLYLDGQLDQAAPIDVTIAPGSDTLYVGRWGGAGRFLFADVDDIVIHSRALVPAEVAELSQRSPPDPR